MATIKNLIIPYHIDLVALWVRRPACPIDHRRQAKVDRLAS